MKRITLFVAFILIWAVGLPVSGAAQDAKTRFKIDSHYHYRNEPDFIQKTVETYRKYNAMVWC